MESVASFDGWGVSFINPILKSAWSFVWWGVSLTRPVLGPVSSFVGWGVSLYTPFWNLSRRLARGGFVLHAP